MCTFKNVWVAFRCANSFTVNLFKITFFISAQRAYIYWTKPIVFIYSGFPEKEFGLIHINFKTFNENEKKVNNIKAVIFPPSLFEKKNWNSFTMQRCTVSLLSQKRDAFERLCLFLFSLFSSVASICPLKTTLLGLSAISPELLSILVRVKVVILCFPLALTHGLCQILCHRGGGGKLALSLVSCGRVFRLTGQSACWQREKKRVHPGHCKWAF